MQRLLIYVLVLFIFSCRSDNKTSRQDQNKNAIENDQGSVILKDSPIIRKEQAERSFVFDQIGLLNEKQEKILSDTLNKFYRQSGIEIYCVTKKNMKPFKTGMDYGKFLMKSYDRKRNKNLVIVILFKEDRKIFIKTNSKSINYYPDAKLTEIIDSFMVPNFKNGNYFEGLAAGIGKLIDEK